MKYQIIKSLMIGFALFSLTAASAQCPSSKYGLNPVWPVSWSQTDRQNWYFDMAMRGQGFQSDGRTWRQLQVMMDSNLLIPYRNDVGWAKSNGGIEKYMFQLKNPISVSNQMPPVWCGNPLSDTNTTNAMFSFITTFLDTMHEVLDYFVLGSETDIYFKSRPQERDSFLVMAAKVSDYIALNYSEIKFSIGLSMDCVMDVDNHYWNLISPFNDFMSVSWWPMGNDYLADSAEINSSSLFISTLVSKCGGKQAVISDCGLPTAIMSERNDLQSVFVRNTFLFTMNDPQIEAVGFYYLADFDTTAIYYYQNLFMSYSPEFHASIISRGLLDSLGNPKPAYDVYLSMLDTVCAISSNIEDPIITNVKVWPNPAIDKIYFDFDKTESYSINTISGQLVMRNAIVKNEGEAINISNLPDGAYFLTLYSIEKTTEIHLFIKYSQP